MTVTVSPMHARNSHHVKLSDGITDVGLILCDPGGETAKSPPRSSISSDPVVRSSIKMYSGEQRHSDLEPPWTDTAQDDFSGGRGGEKYEVDTSKYWDGRQVDTTNVGAILAGMEIWDKGQAVKKHATNWSMYADTTFPRKKYQTYALYGATRYVTVLLEPEVDFNATYLYFYAKKVGSPSGNLTVRIYNSFDLYPTTVKDTTTVAISEELQLCVAVLNPANSTFVTSGAYHIAFIGGASDNAANHYEVLSDGSGSGDRVSSNGSDWSAGATGRCYYRIEEVGKEFRAHFAELKGLLYVAAEYADSSVSKVFSCGTAGMATAGSSIYLRDSNNSAAILNDYYNGAVIRIFDGTGHHLPSPWRWISDTLTTNSEIQVTPAWGLAPGADSVYAIVASDRWMEVTGHGLTTQYISDVVSLNGALYFALGPSVAGKRLRNFWASSTYWQWTNETYQATMLARLTDSGTSELWSCNRVLPAKVWAAPALDCTGTGTVNALTNGTGIYVGDAGEKITGLQVYGETTPQLYVFKEGSVHKLVAEVPQELRISGLRSAADERNGHASAVNDVYLYFSFLDSVERYYDGALDDIGPNRDGGLPSDRRGMISSFVAYPGVLYASIDGGNYNYSSIVAWNGQGYHEIWRAPIAGKRLLGKMYIQPVPGDNVDRLYFSWNGDILSLPVATKPYEFNSMEATEHMQYYAYAPGGSIETSWIHFGLEEVDKLFNAVTITGENLGSAQSRIYLDYKLDDDASYTTAGQFTISGDSGELVLDDATHNITGRRIRIRIRMETLYNNSTPKIDTIIVEGLVTVPSKQRMSLTFRLEDYGKDLLGQPDDQPDADTTLAQLRTWAAAAGTIGMSGCIDELNGLRVKLDYPSIRVVKHEVEEINHRKANRYIAQLSAWVID